MEEGRRVVIGGGADGGRYGSGGSGRRGGFEEEGLKERVEWGEWTAGQAVVGLAVGRTLMD